MFDMLSNSIDKQLELSAPLAVFGVVTQNLILNNNKLNLLSFATLIARRQILVKWKDCNPPAFTQWIKDMVYFIIHVKKIKYTLRGSTQRFSSIWQPFLSRVESLSPGSFKL